MKKNSPLYNNEIDLIILFKIIWNGKIKILLITIISLLIGFGYSYQIPSNYLNSLTIGASDKSEFIRIDNVVKLIESNKSNQSNQSNQSILNRFIDELKDKEEFLIYLKDTKKVRENLIKIPIESQENELFKYAKLLEITESKKDKTNFTINFTWDSPEEAKKILQNTINLTLINLEKLIYKDLDRTLEFQKKISKIRDVEKLDYLVEQSLIAKELNIADNQIDIANFPSSVQFSFDTAEVAYYLRGHRAIDKEIDLIQNRKYQIFDFIEQEINILKATDTQWIIYNVHLMGTKPLKNTILILSILILLGLIVAITYVLIENSIQSQTTSKKNRS
jgi:LPS O-antigen subunit length determinant protein (WzzB/FepE family)